VGGKRKHVSQMTFLTNLLTALAFMFTYVVEKLITWHKVITCLSLYFVKGEGKVVPVLFF